jgi:hypothetical protein
VRWFPFLGVRDVPTEYARGFGLDANWRWKALEFEWLDYGIMLWVWATGPAPSRRA